MESKRRSIGVSIFGWLNILGSIGAFISIFFLKWRLSEYEKNQFVLPDSYYYVVQSHSVVEVIICLIVGIGLLKLIQWARMLAIIQSFLYVAYNLIFFFVFTHNYTIPYFSDTGRSTFLLYTSIPNSVFWLLFVVYFFNRASVKKQFAEKTLI
jgi:hypothetical protein